MIASPAMNGLSQRGALSRTDWELAVTTTQAAAAAKYGISASRGSANLDFSVGFRSRSLDGRLFPGAITSITARRSGVATAAGFDTSASANAPNENTKCFFRRSIRQRRYC